MPLNFFVHDFVTHTQGWLKTADHAVWTPIPGHDGIFLMETEYRIEDGGGTFAGARGTLTNRGIADTTTGLVTLRYQGEICVDDTPPLR